MPLTKITYNGSVISASNQTTPVSVTYGGSQIATISDGFSKTLTCNGKYMTTNVGIGTKTLQCANSTMGSNVTIDVETEITTPLCFTAEQANSNIELCAVGTPPVANSAYSRDGVTWTSFTPSTAGTNRVVLTNVGDVVYFRSTVTGVKDSSNYTRFIANGKVAASGNVMSLYDATNFATIDTISIANCFFYQFVNCAALTVAPNIRIKEVSWTTGSPFSAMFYGCTSITKAPLITATALSSWCCSNMFANCTSLETPPAIYATTIGSSCFNQMFSGCRSLQVNDAPVAGTATQAWRLPSSGTWANASTSNNTFANCAGTRASNNLVATVGGTNTYYTQNVPVMTPLCFTAEQANSRVELIKSGSPSIANTAYSTDGVTWTTFTPSTTAGTNRITLANVGDKVYFRNDITGNFTSSNYVRFIMSGRLAASGNVNSMHSATNFEQLTTLTNYCYSSMFTGCASLTTAPTLPATTLATGCYYYMFADCTSLTAAPVLPATTLVLNCYASMFRGCTSLTTAPTLPATTLANYCYSAMLRGCTSLTIAPTLPATTLADYCYSSMLRGCTSLTTAPALPATTLVGACYADMFNGCTSLQVSDTQTSSTPYAWRIPTSGTFTGRRILVGMFKNCAGTRASDDLDAIAGSSVTYYTQNTPV